MNSWKAFSASCWLRQDFPCKKLSRCFKKCSWLARGQGKYGGWGRTSQPSSFNSFEALVLWSWRMDSFCCPVLAVSLQFLVLLIILLNIHLRCSGFVGIQKVVVSQTGSTTKQVTVISFWCKFDFGKSFELLSPPTELVIASCIKSTFRRTSQSEKWLLCYIE